MELLNGEVKANAVKEAGDTVLALEKEISEKRTEIVQSSANQIAAFNNRYSKMNTLATSEQQLSALKDFYTSQLNLAQKFGLDTTLLTATYEAAKDKIEKKGAEERAKVVQKYGLDTAESTKSMRLKALEEEHQKGLLSEEEYQVSKNKIENQYLQEKIEKNEAYFNAVSNIMGSVSSAIQGFQDAEVNKITRKYDKQIAVAKKAGKDTTKLEEEKEEADSEESTSKWELLREKILWCIQKLWKLLKNIRYTIQSIYDKIRNIIHHIRYRWACTGDGGCCGSRCQRCGTDSCCETTT